MIAATTGGRADGGLSRRRATQTASDRVRGATER